MTAREVHSRAEQAREKGEFGEALQEVVKALMEYAEENDILGFAEALQSQTLTLRHLYEKTGFLPYLQYAVHCAIAGAEAAEKSGDPSATVLPFHTVGKTYETLGEYEQARAWHQKAVNSIEVLPERHNRPGYKAEIKGHLHFTQLMSGDDNGYQMLLEDIQSLEESDELKYNKDVWLSGMHMSAAQGLKNLGRTDEALDHLQKASEIIKANPELKLRATQLEKLRVELGI